MKRLSILSVLLLCATFLMAQYSDNELFAAYLRNDMAAWKSYIDSRDWTQLSRSEQTRLIGYEYGFVAFQLDEDKKITDPALRLGPQYLAQFRNHVSQLKPYLSESVYCCYWSSVNAYDFLLHSSHLKSGMQSYQLAKRAVETDPANPLAHALYGSVLFYAPKMFGGNKSEAYKHFLQAEQLFQNMSPAELQPLQWNYAVIEMYLAQCLDKTQSREAAIQKCHQILELFPDFTYIRSTYLPSLL